MVSWVRLWTDMPTDPKWRVIARKSGQSIGNVIALFNILMVVASEPEDRGSIAGFRVEDASANLDLDEGDIGAIITAMQGRVIEDNRLMGWDKRQPKREDNSYERVKKHREQAKSNARNTVTDDVKRGVTHCNAPETETETDTDTESLAPMVSDNPAGGARRIDAREVKPETTATSNVVVMERPKTEAPPQAQKSTLSPHPQALDLKQQIVQAFAAARCMATPDTGQIDVWLAQGFDPAIILAEVASGIARNNAVRSLRYFTKAIQEASDGKATQITRVSDGIALEPEKQMDGSIILKRRISVGGRGSFLVPLHPVIERHLRNITWGEWCGTSPMPGEKGCPLDPWLPDDMRYKPTAATP